MDEFGFIDRLKKKSIHKENILSIGDDAAVIDNYLIAKDILVENVHFLPSTPIEHVIKKLFVSNISDICAMGGYPEYVLLGISIPEKYNKVNKIVEEVSFNLKQYNLYLIGGDTTLSKSGLFLSLTILGHPHKKILTRSGATPSDLLFISRKTGLSKLSLERELNQNNFDIDPYLHYKNEPELRLSKILSEEINTTSCIDISDGLGRDASHIAEASNVKLIIEKSLLRNENLSKYNLKDSLSYMLNSGEEFGLLFTIDKNDEKLLLDRCKMENISPIKIGFVTKGRGVFLKDGNNYIDISNAGYEHRF
jgi:thiamine-monophosphate kinase